MARGAVTSLLSYIWRYVDLYEPAKDLHDKMDFSQEEPLSLAAVTCCQAILMRQHLHPRRRAQIRYLADPINMSQSTHNASTKVVIVNGRPVLVRRSRVQS